MDKEDLEKLKDFGQRMKQLNKKFRLLNLLRTAKEEYDKSRFEDCIKTCEEALKTDPDNPVALRGLGCSMISLGRLDDALTYFVMALEHSKNKEIEYTLIGTIYYLEDNLDQALDYYNLAIDLNDDYDPAYEGKNQTMLERHLQICDLQDLLIKQEFSE